MNRRDLFLVALVAVFAMVLTGRVVYQGVSSLPTLDQSAHSYGGLPQINEELLKKKILEGRLSDHEALYYETF